MIINENSILYFSGTGNTYEVSEAVAKKCGFKLVNVSTLIEGDTIEVNCESIGFTFPIYYGGIPKIINRIISKIKILKVEYIFAIATYGGMPGNPLKIFDSQLAEKEIKLGSGFLINMPGNYIPMYGARRKSVQIKNFKKFNKRVEKIVSVINSKQIVPYEESPYIIDRPFSKFSPKRIEELSSYDVNFKADNKCVKCGICIKICPVKNIKLENGMIKWLGKCEQCMACIQYCPKESIQFGKKTTKRQRYRNPNVDYLKVLLKE